MASTDLNVTDEGPHLHVCQSVISVKLAQIRSGTEVRWHAGRMNVNLRRVWVTQCAVAACGVAFLVGFVGRPSVYDGWWNSDSGIWTALLVSAVVLGVTFGLVGGLAARAGYTWMAQAAVVAFAPLA